MSTATIETKAQEYREGIKTLEQSVKDWEDARVRKVSDSADKCYDAFNDFQMSIAKLKKPETIATYNKHQIWCYKFTYDFLCFIENKTDIEWCAMLLNKSHSFSKLINHYSDYCAKIEEYYNIELESEKEWGKSKKATDALRKYLKNEQMPQHP